VSAKDWERYAGRAGYVKNQGFYVYRERRLIIHGTWFGLARQTELTKLSRVRIDTPRELDSEWKIDVKKASAQPPAALRERLRRLVEQIGASSKRVYTHRGKTLVDDNRLPVWNRVQDKGEIKYRLNMEHPVFASLVEHLPSDMIPQFRHAVELVAAGLPLDALLVDFGGKPEAVTTSQMTEDALADSAITTYRTLALGEEHESPAILSMMSAVEPFRSRWEETRTVLQAAFGWN
jgi:hypothetical protein